MERRHAGRQLSRSVQACAHPGAGCRGSDAGSATCCGRASELGRLAMDRASGLSAVACRPCACLAAMRPAHCCGSESKPCSIMICLSSSSCTSPHASCQYALRVHDAQRLHPEASTCGCRKAASAGCPDSRGAAASTSARQLLSSFCLACTTFSASLHAWPERQTSAQACTVHGLLAACAASAARPAHPPHTSRTGPQPAAVMPAAGEETRCRLDRERPLNVWAGTSAGSSWPRQAAGHSRGLQASPVAAHLTPEQGVGIGRLSSTHSKSRLEVSKLTCRPHTCGSR